MHTAGFLHRDICPRNVMVNKEGVVKIIDLGLPIPNKPEFCKPGNRTGTTIYLAPELISRSTTDHRVDMFALGVTAYEAFTGELPWERGSSQEVLRAIVNQNARDPRELRPGHRRRRRQIPDQGSPARSPQPLPDARRVPRGAAEAAGAVTLPV